MISGTKDIITDEVILSERCEEIDTLHDSQLLQEIIKYLKRTLRKRDDLFALSAPAIGYNKRVFCMKFENDQIKTFINPVIESYSPNGMQLSREKCSSIPGKEYIRVRNNDIRVMYQRPTGEAESNRLLGKAALVFQHELDHLEGVLISDIGLEVIPEFDEATDEERSEVIKEYLDSLDIRLKQTNDEIQNDPELKQIDDATKFMTGILTGEIKQTEE
jgi:peptide deformylase